MYSLVGDIMDTSTYFAVIVYIIVFKIRSNRNAWPTLLLFCHENSSRYIESLSRRLFDEKTKTTLSLWDQEDLISPYLNGTNKNIIMLFCFFTDVTSSIDVVSHYLTCYVFSIIYYYLLTCSSSISHINLWRILLSLHSCASHPKVLLTSSYTRTTHSKNAESSFMLSSGKMS